MLVCVRQSVSLLWETFLIDSLHNRAHHSDLSQQVLGAGLNFYSVVLQTNHCLILTAACELAREYTV